jgi:hypothetical protein
MLDTDYERALVSATKAENRYLEAVRRGEERDLLTELAGQARDLWVTVATVCALGEDAARFRLADLPMIHRNEALHTAWLDRRNWAVCGEDAAARAELAGALVNAHRGASTITRRVLRLVETDA